MPANSGAPGRPITFQPDGDAEVTVSGADLVDGDWTVHRGQIYQTVIALPLAGYGEQITGNVTLLANQVFVDGKMMVEARWPNLAGKNGWPVALCLRGCYLRGPRAGGKRRG